MTVAALTAEILSDRARERTPPPATPSCWSCGRPFTYRKPEGDDSSQFCTSTSRCRDAYDAGAPRHADLRNAASWINEDMSRGIQVAGAPIPRCDRCDGLAVELVHGKGGAKFCHWRCRDNKPRDCIACGTNLYGIARRGPYCSDACAQRQGLKRPKRASGAKPQNQAPKSSVNIGFLEPVFEADGRPAGRPA